LTSSQAAQLFSPTTGIGLQYIRSHDFGCPGTGSCAITATNIPDLVTMQEAYADGAQIIVGIDPPANLQYSGTNGGAADPSTGNCIDSANWAAFATFTVQWIQFLNANSAPVSVLEVGNEPDDTWSSTGGTLDACHWSASGLDSYIKGNLGPALASAGLSSVKIMMPSTSGWFSPDYATTCLNDSACAPYVSIAASHGYDGAGSVDGTGSQYCCATATAPPSSTSGKHVWMSEVNGGFNYDSTSALWKWDSSMADALVWAHSIHDYLTVANASAWLYWELLDVCAGIYTGGCINGPLNDGFGYPTGSGQIPTSLNFGSRYYAIGNWSKFVRSGYSRIDATTNPQAGVYVTAFQNTSTGSLVIVAINNNSSSAGQTFAISNAPSFSTVTPYVTSASLHLAAQSAVSVSSQSFSYTLPASSVTTFVGLSGGVTPVITSASTAACGVGLACSYQITASNSPTSYSASGLPSTMSINTSTGLISGTPTTFGNYTVTLGASNSSGTGNLTLTLTVGYFVQQFPYCTVHSASSLPCASTTNLTAGDVLLVPFDFPTGATVTGVTDTQGNTFTHIGSQLATPGGDASQVWYAKNVSAGADTITIAFSGTVSYIDAWVAEYTGLSTSSPLDVQAGATGSTGPANSGNATTTSANDLIWGFCIPDATCSVPGSGFIVRSTSGDAIVEDQVQGAAGSYNANAAITGSGWSMQMVALKPATVAGSVTGLSPFIIGP
jgi:O-glycosyl hydrolase